jgi:thiamine pyrophosphate-dependent acetolactate synthase large subunit-like protein
VKVYEAMAKAFAAEGTTAVFDLMGDANMYWLNALDRLGV